MLIVHSLVTQSCPTLWDSMNCRLPGSSVHGIYQARVLGWIAISFSRGSFHPRNRTRVSHIVGRRFTIWATREIITSIIIISISICLWCSYSFTGLGSLCLTVNILTFNHLSDQIRSDQSLSRVQLIATPWTTARQAFLSITNSWSSLILTSIKSVMPSSHIILCLLLLLPPIPPSIRVFSN